MMFTMLIPRSFSVNRELIYGVIYDPPVYTIDERSVTLMSDAGQI